MQKSLKSVDKSKLGQGKEDPRRKVKTPIQVQAHVQSGEESQVGKQTELKQKEGMCVPQIRQNTDKCMGWEPENDTAPEYINRPQVTEIKIPVYPDPLMKPHPDHLI